MNKKFVHPQEQNKEKLSSSIKSENLVSSCIEQIYELTKRIHNRQPHQEKKS
jgi:hypothetical protein